jgi:NAD(P)-dependent dehydrogenase (short-subunit alcohol dehydrogenase family)
MSSTIERIVITGASSGIGLDAARRFLRAGSSVLINGSSPAKLAQAERSLDGGGGAIINVGSVLVGQGKTDAPVSAAMASKGGVHALTVCWAAELAKHAIRVNTVAPGIIRTPPIGAHADDMASWHPLGRIGEPNDTSEASFYLATAAFVSGIVLDVGGGFAHAR